MPAFAADGTVTCPFPAAWLEFFNADKDKWTANAYRTPDCIGSREFSHGSFVAALPDGSFPPTFLWDEISYRVIAKAADGTVIAKIDRVTPESEFAAVEPVAVAEPVAKVAASDPREEELAALRARVAELEARDASVFAEPVIQEPERARDELLDFDDAIRDLPAMPDDLSQLMTGDETLGRAVERLTPGVDELLDMASALSESSLETAIATIPPERVNEWTEKLITEKARLRLLRGTDQENFPRENLVNRVQTMFAQVGAKR